MNDWPIVGIARFRAEPHGSAHVWVLDQDATEPRDCGSVYTPVAPGSNFYGYRVVCSQEWRRILRAQRTAVGGAA
jgi:hypothetical protein